MTSPSTPAPEPERTFGRYRLGALIARGGMAEVYRAEQRLGGGVTKKVVIKKIRPSVAQDPDFVAMFDEEAAIAAGLSHGNIAQVFDFGEIEGERFLAIELVDGPSAAELADRAQLEGLRMPPEYACFVVMEVCKALHYAHTRTDAQGKPLHIVHRDVSPQNVLISYEGQVKLVDFGVAKAYGVDDRPGRARTATGVVKGKYSYFSPEQARARPLDAQADVYAAGVVLYELLCGRLPFEGEMYEMLGKLMAGEFPAPSSLNPDIDARLEAVILRAMAFDKRERYPSALALQEALAADLAVRAPRFTQSTLAGALGYLFRREREGTSGAEPTRPMAEQVKGWARVGEGATVTSPLAIAPPRPSTRVVASTLLQPTAPGSPVTAQRKVLIDLELAALGVVEGALAGVRASLEVERLVLGRDERCQVILAHRSVSRRHCELTRDPQGAWHVRDLGSANGIAINGARVDEGVLHPGDRLEVGHLTLQLLDRGELLPDRAAVAPARSTGTLPERWNAPLLATLGATAVLALGGLAWLAWGPTDTAPTVPPKAIPLKPVHPAPPRPPEPAPHPEPAPAPQPTPRKPPEPEAPPEPAPAPQPQADHGAETQALRKRGVELTQRGRLKMAETVLQTALALDPDDPDTLRALAGAFARDGQFPKAAVYYRRFIALRPDDPSVPSIREALEDYEATSR